jgi:hypothetical protein
MNDQDFRTFAISKGQTRSQGIYTYYIGNPYDEVLREATVYVENEPWGKLVNASIQDPPALYQNGFQVVSNIATVDEVIVLPPGVCFTCGSYIEAMGEPDFMSVIYNTYAQDIIDTVSSNLGVIKFLIFSFFGKYDTVVVVFPNGDTVKLDIKSLTLSPGSIAVQAGSAVDADGNPLDGQGDTSHYGGSQGGGSFCVHVSTISGIGEQWYICGPDGNGGYGCAEIPPPEDPEEVCIN